MEFPERRKERLFSGESAMPGQDVLNILYRWTIGTAYMMPGGSETVPGSRGLFIMRRRSLRRLSIIMNSAKAKAISIAATACF